LARQCRAAAIFAAASIALAGCSLSWVPFVGTKSSKAPAPVCPVAVVLRPLANTVVFGPAAERRPINVAWYGILSDVSATCTTAGGALRAALDIVVAAERGAAAGSSDSVDLNYFVAVTGTDHAILSKNPFAVHVPIAAGVKRSGVTDHVEMAIDTGGRPVSDLNIIVGFQQTPEAIEFYKNYRGR
jgi:hypothetical protein